MLTYEKITYEEALLRSIKNNSETVGKILDSEPGDNIIVSFNIYFRVPSTYAKEILKEYINENCHN